jgi:medium-chain acyl-[acyl-carrier-protein] hydrolase
MTSFMELRRPPRPTVTICCFPHAGGGSAMFRHYRVAPDTLLLGVDLPGHAARFGEPLLSTMDEVIAALLPESARLPAPYLLFGHSLGAIIAFELTRALELIGKGPAHLVVSGRRPPDVASPREPIASLPDPEFIEAIRRYGGSPDEVLAQKEVMDLALPILRADFAVSESYRYPGGPPVRADLTVLGATDDTAVDPATLGGWARHTCGSFDVRTFTGGHFFVNQNNIGELLSDLAARVVAQPRP